MKESRTSSIVRKLTNESIPILRLSDPASDADAIIDGLVNEEDKMERESLARELKTLVRDLSYQTFEYSSSAEGRRVSFKGASTSFLFISYLAATILCAYLNANALSYIFAITGSVYLFLNLFLTNKR